MEELTDEGREAICRGCINYRRPKKFMGKVVGSAEPYCFSDQTSIARHVSLVVCPIGRFPDEQPAVASSEALEVSEGLARALTLLEASKAVPCVPCAKKAAAEAAACGNCGGEHETAKCPIPASYDGNYQNDSGGDPGCNCA